MSACLLVAFVSITICVEVRAWVPVACLHYCWVCLTMWVLLDNLCFLEQAREYERRLHQPDMFEVIQAIREELRHHPEGARARAPGI